MKEVFIKAYGVFQNQNLVSSNDQYAIFDSKEEAQSFVESNQLKDAIIKEILVYQTIQEDEPCELKDYILLIKTPEGLKPYEWDLPDWEFPIPVYVAGDADELEAFIADLNMLGYDTRNFKIGRILANF